MVHPLLVFPMPARVERVKRSGGRQSLRIPDAGAQGRRLAPQFQRLQQVMGRQRVSLQGNALGLQPELALVLETIGSVDGFIKAVARIHGLEWLGEMEIEGISPDHGFEDENDPQKQLSGQLYLMMTDQRALEQLQSIFDRWQQCPSMAFPRGLSPLGQVFAHLRSIRPWGAEDRVRETGLFADWQLRAQYGEKEVPFEAELWFRAQAQRRYQSESYLRGVIESLGGEVTQQAVISEIAYHGILGRIPLRSASAIMAQRSVRLLNCEDVMFLRPLGQCAIRVSEDTSDSAALKEDPQRDVPRGEPLVALLDGMPLQRHRLLAGRLIVDDPDGYESAYLAHERLHGTAMASLICHGDLHAGGRCLSRPLYVRPIMQPYRGFGGRFDERIPEEALPVDVIHRAVRRLYESEGGEPPAAPSVRVVNLSVCDLSRPLDREMSPLARLLDWLSWKYRVLFVVSAGNHSRDVELSIPRTDLRGVRAEDRERAVIEAIAMDTRNRRLLAPAETVNGITVAATHSDVSIQAPGSLLVDPYARAGLPSTTNAHGPGYRRSVKPDILLPGGRQFLFEKLGTAHTNAILETRGYSSPPGQCVATPGSSGDLNRTCYTRGTSNSAALASRWTVFLADLLCSLRDEYGATIPLEYDVVLLKALLVHGADWSDAGRVYTSVLRKPQNSRTFTDYVGRFLGYGEAQVANVMLCTDQRVTVLGFGRLNDGQADEFFLPLPPSLSARTDRRRLTITLAWLSPVDCRRQKYRVAHLWVDPRNNLAPDRTCADHRAVQRGTVQHEILEGARALDFQDGDHIVIRVNCRADAGTIPEPVPYGLVVSLQVAQEIALPIYQEVRNRLRVRVPIQRV